MRKFGGIRIIVMILLLTISFSGCGWWDTFSNYKDRYEKYKALYEEAMEELKLAKMQIAKLEKKLRRYSDGVNKMYD